LKNKHKKITKDNSDSSNSLMKVENV